MRGPDPRPPARATVLAVLLGSLALAALQAAPMEAAHPFYERLLREGTLALERGELEAAARDLGIAAFGLLEDPPLLAETLTRLALAQARLEDPAGFRRTFGRLSELEERFGAYTEARLDPSERNSFEARILQMVPPELLARTPGFGHLTQGEPETEAPSTEAPPEREPAPGSPAGEPSGEPSPREAEPGTPRAGVSEPGGGSGAEPAPPAPPPLSGEERSRIAEARRILSTATHAQELERALELAAPVADAHPGRRALQELVGEIAYRSSRWPAAVRYLDRAELTDARPELLFYLAVALHETGQREPARRTLERALPRLERTEFVDGYVERILSPEPDREADPDVP